MKETNGCQVHPSYGGVRKPRTDCPECLKLYESKHGKGEKEEPRLNSPVKISKPLPSPSNQKRRNKSEKVGAEGPPTPHPYKPTANEFKSLMQDLRRFDIDDKQAQKLISAYSDTIGLSIFTYSALYPNMSEQHAAEFVLLILDVLHRDGKLKNTAKDKA